MKRNVKPSKTVFKPLKDVVCYVETFNEDGTSACESTIKVLQQLGATVDPVFKMGLTHMIWSNGNLKHIKAAEFMDIIVVSPLWVENCRESGKMVPENDFEISPDSVGSIAKTKPLVEPLVKPASFLREPDSPSFSSSQIIASAAVHPLRVLDRNIQNSTIIGAKSKKPAKSTNKRPAPVPDEENASPGVSSNERNSKQARTAAPVTSTSFRRSISPEVDGGTVNRRASRSSPRLVKPSAERETDGVPTPPVITQKASSTKKTKLRTGDALSDSSSRVVAALAAPKAASESKAKSQVKSVKSSNAPTDVIMASKRVDDRGKWSAVKCISLSGFEGEKRSMLRDILLSLVSSASAAQSSKGSKQSVQLISDDDTSIKSLLNCSHVVAATEDERRSIRVLFALARDIPVVTEHWVTACLEAETFLEDCSSYLHPRFGRAVRASTTSGTGECSKVYVGPCVDPSRTIVRSLVQAWPQVQETTDISIADFVIMDSSRTGFSLLRRECSMATADADLKTAHIEELHGLGRVLTCKEFFDCIENNKLEPVKSKPSAPTASGSVSRVATSKASACRASANTMPSTASVKTAVVKSTSKGLAENKHSSKQKISRDATVTKQAKESSKKTPVSALSSISGKQAATDDTPVVCTTGRGDGSGVGSGQVVIALDEEDSPSFEDALKQSTLSTAAPVQSDGRSSRSRSSGKQQASRLEALRFDEEDEEDEDGGWISKGSATPIDRSRRNHSPVIRSSSGSGSSAARKGILSLSHRSPSDKKRPIDPDIRRTSVSFQDDNEEEEEWDMDRRSEPDGGGWVRDSSISTSKKQRLSLSAKKEDDISLAVSRSALSGRLVKPVGRASTVSRRSEDNSEDEWVDDESAVKGQLAGKGMKDTTTGKYNKEEGMVEEEAHQMSSSLDVPSPSW